MKKIIFAFICLTISSFAHAENIKPGTTGWACYKGAPVLISGYTDSSYKHAYVSRILPYEGTGYGALGKEQLVKTCDLKVGAIDSKDTANSIAQAAGGNDARGETVSSASLQTAQIDSSAVSSVH